jgi:predicted phosphodiesterase
MFAGDPHGNFSPILRACAATPAGTLILLGDCDCAQPLPEILAPALKTGWEVNWILGNHDTETEARYDNLVPAHPTGNFGLRVIDVHGVRLAGLPGVFKPRVWQPCADAASGRIDPPQFHTRREFMQAIGPQALWRGGLPLWHRDTIFPEDFDVLRALRCDILVSHEAPSSHRHGASVIDDLAAACGARLIVHGHHHESYVATLPNGIAVRGLAIAETWLLPS